MIKFSMGPADTGMGLLEWSSAVIGAVAWPIAIVTIAFLFRQPIIRLLKRIKSASLWDASVDFTDELDRLEEKVEAIVQDEEPASISPPVSQNDMASDETVIQTISPPLNSEEHPSRHSEGKSQLDNLLSRADFEAIWKSHLLRQATRTQRQEPSITVVQAWELVELLLAAKTKELALGVFRPSASWRARALLAAGYIDQDTADTINEMYRLQREVAHGKELTFTDAFRFDKLAMDLAKKLKAIDIDKINPV